MGSAKFLEGIIEEKLLHLHTAFFSKVLSSDGKTAKIQPLSMYKQIGGAAQKHPPIEKVPILQTVKKFKYEDCICGAVVAEHSLQTEKRKHLVIEDIGQGDIVLCLCSERDITSVKKGEPTIPVIGHHSMQDAVIIGVL